MSNNLLKQARLFAIKAHASLDHRRKHTEEPYHVHLERVATLVSTLTDDSEIIAAAWLHDVLEDIAPKNAEFSAEVIGNLFGDRVLALVLEVTDVSKPSDGNRDVRKEIDRKHLAQSSDGGKIIKLADLYDNLIDIAKHDPHFAKVFHKEARLCLPLIKPRVMNKNTQNLYKKLQEMLS